MHRSPLLWGAFYSWSFSSWLTIDRSAWFLQFGPAYPTINNWSIGASAMLCWAKEILNANCFKAWKQLLCSAFCYCGGMYCHPTSFISTEWFKDYWIGQLFSPIFIEMFKALTLVDTGIMYHPSHGWFTAYCPTSFFPHSSDQEGKFWYISLLSDSIAYWLL